MRKVSIFLLSAFLVVGCSSDGENPAFLPAPTECSNDAQKQFVLDALYDWYLWNFDLPGNLSIDDYASPEELVFAVTTTYGPQDTNGNPIDRWSSVGSLQADQQFFGEGKYEGFGFRWRFEGADMRMVSVYADSPAGVGGLDRGQTVITLNGRTVADIDGSEGISAFFDANDTVAFEVADVGGAVMPLIEITKGIVTIDPIPQTRIINIGDGAPPVGYIQFETFISTANPVFDSVFADFIAAGVKDVVLDLRNNGGGLVRTAELLGDYLGGFANDNEIFSETEYNPDRNAEYSLEQRVARFARLGNSIDLTRVIVIATRGTASASELVTNALDPFADVWIVGDNTYGKPVGQIGLDFCEKILRPTSFRTKNAAGFTDYFDGLPVDCPAADDLDIPIGDDLDPNIIAATTISATGGCPVVAAPDGFEAAPQIVDEIRYPELTGPPEREFAGSF
jgi:C-terminal processing protease CtpA/Prc